MKKKTSELLSGLNVEQKAAVTHLLGPQLIVAGAGTGKTTVITRRIAWLIEQGLAGPSEILALTFTEKAAGEMEERVDRLLPYGLLDVWISTFHAFGQRLLGRHALDIGLPVDFKVLSATDCWLLLRRNLDRLELSYYRPLGSPTRFLHALIKHFSRAKDELVTPERYEAHATNLRLDTDRERASIETENSTEAARVAEVAKAYAAYQKLLAENNALDFGDLINCSLELLKRRPAILERYRRQFKYILVDEFQDTNLAQYELVKLLSAPVNNLTVVGDDDQSIYKFRGASVSNILKFQQDFPQAVSVALTKNYRGRQNLLDLAYKFIQGNNPDRLEVKLEIDKRLTATQSGRGIIELRVYRDHHQEAEAVAARVLVLQKNAPAAWSDFAVLLRANDSAEIFVQALAKLGIPCMQLSRKGLYRKPVVLDVISYFRLLDNYHESRAMFRVLNLPGFQFSHDDLAFTTSFAHRKTCSIYETLKRPELTSRLTEAGQMSAAKLLQLIEQHSAQARTRLVSELYVQVVADLGLGKLNRDEARQVADLNELDQFYRKIQDFAAVSESPLLKDFMEVMEMEINSGEQGSLDFDPDQGPEAVKIITAHSSKGLEYRFVFLPGLVDKRFPTIARGEPIELPEALVSDILSGGDFHLQEERRLFYVAMTRAREGLFFSYAQDYGGAGTRKASVFLQAVGDFAKLESGQPKFAPAANLPAPKPRAPKFTAPKNHSFSSISVFRKCALEYKYTYLLKIPRPGNAKLSFGQTIHRSLENYLKFYQQLSEQRQGELFAGQQQQASQALELPAFEKLAAFYRGAWVDDWFGDKITKQGYKQRGLEILRNIYEKFQQDPPRPKYLEQNFKLGLADYVFTGKFDRADETAKGLRVIDYKTGSARELSKVDREQLLIYQCAAQEFLREKVYRLEYWYLLGEVWPVEFLGTEPEIKTVKDELIEAMDRITTAVERDSFSEIHAQQAKRHVCEFEGFIE